ncbi:MAG: Na+/H+ antiporter NhaC family protein, partial [Candidatus Eisenbacteria bacterium]|nr:Na+/H+ antiporter NhaC family protein [Candidatus Eisenbacteria bacterium]
LADFESDALRPKKEVAPRPINALLPILAVVAATLIGLWYTGSPAAGSPSLADFFHHPQPHRLVGDIFGAADSYSALLWASALGGILALVLAWGQRILDLGEGISAWVGGLRGMLLAAIILVLAWSLGDICREIGTSPYLVGLLSEHLNPHFLPLLIFIVASLVSFATGTSWGTMAILIPVTIPLAIETCRYHGFDPGPAHRILLGSLSSILAGAVFGDHCSPISDTTVLSSLATSCDHVDHVRTQLPYALLAGFTGIVLGDLPSAFGMSPWWSLLLGALALTGFVFILGRRVPADSP